MKIIIKYKIWDFLTCNWNKVTEKVFDNSEKAILFSNLNYLNPAFQFVGIETEKE
jgi:hypothetical protein